MYLLIYGFHLHPLQSDANLFFKWHNSKDLRKIMNINKSENMDASCICIFPVCRMKIENCELNALISIKICFSGSRLTNFGETENLKKNA